MGFLPNRIKSDIIMNDDRTVVSVTYRFRGLAEAETFKQWVDQSLRLSKDFFDESDAMDRFCKENNCENF